MKYFDTVKESTPRTIHHPHKWSSRPTTGKGKGYGYLKPKESKEAT